MIENYFPSALPIPKLKEFVSEKLSEKNLNQKNTLWATSVCSDEVNQSLHQLDEYFETFGPFILGGISGIPFAGKTGFKAFASHIPDHGGAFIIYGPHVGITQEGEIGKVHRAGQKLNTSSCGSVIGALNTLKSDENSEKPTYDYQQEEVKNLLRNNWAKLSSSDDQIITATEITYTEIKHEIREIITSCISYLEDKPLLAVGGILINTHPSDEDLFDIRDIDWY
ncbi:hypothetical protein [Rhodohalobacter halophilus]|uniref:hypothetical protein n=1 Tax=Rhodohalobacter halophilus TaxID=1812810 RepID=UPI00083FCB80|nr:hypothetical protein [Rhodohalobacter halophilus]